MNADVRISTVADLSSAPLVVEMSMHIAVAPKVIITLNSVKAFCNLITLEMYMHIALAKNSAHSEESIMS